MNTNNEQPIEHENNNITESILHDHIAQENGADNDSNQELSTDVNVVSDDTVETSSSISTEFPSIPEEPFLSRPQWIQFYLVAVIFSNLYLLFLDGHFDIGFWKNWTTQLATTGFANYQGDYPPLWSDWLYVVSRFYLYFQLPIENTILFKYLTQLPITMYHLALTGIIYKMVKYSKSDIHFHAALILTAFNPAILFNGPIWGQIDVTPLIPLIAGLLAGVSKRHQIYTFPLYLIAMLTKFQMIAFAPVFGILFFRNIRTHLLSTLLCIPIFIIAFLPAILAHNFVQAFSLPYIGSLNMFSAATMGASNIWILLTGNLAPDNIVLFGIDPTASYAQLFTVRRFGMISFSIICLFVFIKGMKKLAERKFEQNQEVSSSEIFFYALMCTVTFFTILPGMHERYLLPASIIALAYYATSPTKIFYPIALGFISAFNLTMSHGIRTNSIWPSLSWIMLAVFCYGICELFWGKTWLSFVKSALQKITAIKWLSVWVLLITSATTTYILYQQTKINREPLAENQLFLSQLTPSAVSQDYGTLQINLNVSGKALSFGGKRYADGLGTHANSTINFALPANAKELSFIAGLDDEVDAADVMLSVWGDGKLLWQSAILYHAEQTPTKIKVNVEGIQEISLRANAVSGISGDHVDWINPIITLGE